MRGGSIVNRSPREGRLTGSRVAEAGEIFDRMMTSSEFAEFLTLVGYDYIA